MRRLNRLSQVCCFLLLTQSVFALQGDMDQPLELAADSVELDEASGESLYKGNVEMRQGSMRLLADSVTIRSESNKPNKVIARGKVRFEQDTGQGMVEARAGLAEYALNSELLELSEGAVLNQNGDTLSSDRIVYDRLRHKVKAGAAAQGSQRVKITIQPKQR